MRLGKPTAIALAAVLVAVLAAAPALGKPGKLIDKGTDNGFPIAYARGFAESPRALLMRVKSDPRQPVEVRWQVTCRRGGKSAKVPSGTFTFTPTKTKKMKMGTRRPDDCTVDVQAAYVTADVAGKITIELFARTRR